MGGSTPPSGAMNTPPIPDTWSWVRSDELQQGDVVTRPGEESSWRVVDDVDTSEGHLGWTWIKVLEPGGPSWWRNAPHEAVMRGD